MNDKEYYNGVRKLLDTLVANAAHSFGIDFMLLNEIAIETSKRMKTNEEQL